MADQKRPVLTTFTAPDVVPVQPTLEERLHNAVADQAMENFHVTPAEQERIKVSLSTNGGR